MVLLSVSPGQLTASPVSYGCTAYSTTHLVHIIDFRSGEHEEWTETNSGIHSLTWCVDHREYSMFTILSSIQMPLGSRHIHILMSKRLRIWFVRAVWIRIWLKLEQICECIPPIANNNRYKILFAIELPKLCIADICTIVQCTCTRNAHMLIQLVFHSMKLHRWNRKIKYAVKRKEEDSSATADAH